MVGHRAPCALEKQNLPKGIGNCPCCRGYDRDHHRGASCYQSPSDGTPVRRGSSILLWWSVCVTVAAPSMRSVPAPNPFPLDLQSTRYSYVERPNPVIVSMLSEHVLAHRPDARVLDIGCGCGANARAIRAFAPEVRVTGIEPNERAADLARAACSDVFEGTLERWLDVSGKPHYEAVVLSDVLEHIADPVGFLRSLTAAPELRGSTWIISVPNYGVWYNRIRTLLGRFDYAWSGLYDRTHLRFFTRRSIRQLLGYAGLEVVEDRCTPSIVQSAAPILRRFFGDDVASGNHLALTENRGYQLYQKLIEPVETSLCAVWPELMGFQVVTVARAS